VWYGASSSAGPHRGCPYSSDRRWAHATIFGINGPDRRWHCRTHLLLIRSRGSEHPRRVRRGRTGSVPWRSWHSHLCRESRHRPRWHRPWRSRPRRRHYRSGPESLVRATAPRTTRLANATSGVWRSPGDAIASRAFVALGGFIFLINISLQEYRLLRTALQPVTGAHAAMTLVFAPLRAGVALAGTRLPLLISGAATA